MPSGPTIWIGGVLDARGFEAKAGQVEIVSGGERPHRGGRAGAGRQDNRRSDPQSGGIVGPVGQANATHRGVGFGCRARQC